MSADSPSPPYEDENLLEFVLSQLRTPTRTDTLVIIASTFDLPAFCSALMDDFKADSFERWIHDEHLTATTHQGHYLFISKSMDHITSNLECATAVVLYKTPLSNGFTEILDPRIRAKSVLLFVVGDDGRIVNAFPASKSAAKH